MSALTPEQEATLSAPDTQAGWLQRLCLAQIETHRTTEGGLPTAATFIYYELKDQFPERHLKPGKKTMRTWRQDVADAILDLRIAGLVAWSDIRDDTRRLVRYRSASSVYTYVAESTQDARIDPWRGHRPLVICESRAVEGVLHDIVAVDYRAQVIGTGGQVHGVLETDIIPVLVGTLSPVLYIGDLNNAGKDIEANTRRIIEATTGTITSWTRVALTRAQVARYHLPAKQTVDGRYKVPTAELSYECEALGQPRIQQMLRDALDALLPEPLEHVRVREQQQRQDVARLLNQNGRRR